jgi:putative solute:sodium symporter small subunit
MTDRDATLPPTDADRAARARDYWRRNLRLLAVLLLAWALVSFGAGIVWAEQLNRWTLPGTGFPLGFWFAQQGAIYVFLLVIVAYVVLANRLDRRFGVWER